MGHYARDCKKPKRKFRGKLQASVVEEEPKKKKNNKSSKDHEPRRVLFDFIPL